MDTTSLRLGVDARRWLGLRDVFKTSSQLLIPSSCYTMRAGGRKRRMLYLDLTLSRIKTFVSDLLD